MNDFDPIILEKVEHESRVFHLKAPLVINVEFNQGENQLEARFEPLEIWVLAEDREQLEKRVIEGVAEELALLWDEYALADPATLSRMALKMREKVLATFEEVKNEL